MHLAVLTQYGIVTAKTDILRQHITCYSQHRVIHAGKTDKKTSVRSVVGSLSLRPFVRSWRAYGANRCMAVAS